MYCFPPAKQEHWHARQSIKYAHLSATHCFMPNGVETLGLSGKEALAGVGQAFKGRDREPPSSYLLIQRTTVTIKKRNATAILGTSSMCSSLDCM